MVSACCCASRATRSCSRVSGLGSGACGCGCGGVSACCGLGVGNGCGGGASGSGAGGSGFGTGAGAGFGGAARGGVRPVPGSVTSTASITGPATDKVCGGRDHHRPKNNSASRPACNASASSKAPSLSAGVSIRAACAPRLPPACSSARPWRRRPAAATP
ncbi:MAG: hypothetical protein CVV14_14365 [Gammaproteobacteria bacterium HGW-Gammaproteobacteria-4]|nr:MAG: hypothetical protein CVV14_14365 [Gammaproteobacteria bacterium HGW-Gammaproteobacteria-4]